MALTSGEQSVFASELSRAITLRSAQADALTDVDARNALFASNPAQNGSAKVDWVVGQALLDALQSVANLRATASALATVEPSYAEDLGDVFEIAE